MPKKYRGRWSGRSSSGDFSRFDPWAAARVTDGRVPNYRSIVEPVFKGPDAGDGNHTIAEMRALLRDGADYLLAMRPLLEVAGIEAQCVEPKLTGVPEAPTEPTLKDAEIVGAGPLEADFVAEVSGLETLLFWIGDAKRRAANQRYREALAEWQAENENADKVSRMRAQAFAAYQKKKQDWDARLAPIAARFETACHDYEVRKQALMETIAADQALCAELIQRYADGDPVPYIQHILRRSPYPAAFPHYARCSYHEVGRYLVAEIELPNSRALIEEALLTAKPKPTKADREALIEDTPIALLIRVLREVVTADNRGLIDTIVVNGRLRWHDPASGRLRHEIVASVQAGRDVALALELGTLRPRECYRMLKGTISTGLTSGHVEPVIPFLQIERDGRVVAPRDVLDQLPADANLAQMPWEDFEHLIRELFAKEFASTSAEVSVTRASRDWGVDALIQDPDPIRGGKFVVQAKRYTNVVGVDAVRDLFGTVMNEGANRGILVTTSHYGPQSHEFAKGKPLTLIDGAGLLALLEKHGYSYTIGRKH